MQDLSRGPRSVLLLSANQETTLTRTTKFQAGRTPPRLKSTQNQIRRRLSYHHEKHNTKTCTHPGNPETAHAPGSDHRDHNTGVPNLLPRTSEPTGHPVSMLDFNALPSRQGILFVFLVVGNKCVILWISKIISWLG
jgi:hypothetical protein